MPVYAKMDELLENFRRGGGVVFHPKNFVAIFCIRNCTFGQEFPEKLRNGEGHFRPEKFRCKFSAGRHEFLKKSQHF